MNFKNIALVGSTGGIGRAFLQEFIYQKNVEQIYTFSRTENKLQSSKIKSFLMDITNENSIQKNISCIHSELDLVIIATGILHNKEVAPEKTFKDLSFEQCQKVFLINTFVPALLLKYFIPFLNKNKRSIIAVLSARVGSITDNYLGGWYSYRSSKAALNMMVKTFSLEVARKFKQAILVGLHPGTVDTNLSKPFQSFVSKEKLFSPQDSVQKLLSVLNRLSVQDTGKVFAWDGQEIPY